MNSNNLLYDEPGWAVKEISLNLNAPFEAVWVVVPFNIGEYAPPAYEPVILIVAVDELSELTIWLNWSTKAT